MKHQQGTAETVVVQLVFQRRNLQSQWITLRPRPCVSRIRPKFPEPAHHLVVDLPHLHPVCPSCRHLPFPVDSNLSLRQRQGTAQRALGQTWIYWTTPSHIGDDFLSKLSGDAQSETGQSDASHPTAPPPRPPHQLPSLRLRLLARAGLRRPGDIGQVPAASRRVSSFGVCPCRSCHNRIQPNGTIGWIQPDGAPPKRQNPGRGGDVSADVQEFHRSRTLTFRRGLKKSWEKKN